MALVGHSVVKRVRPDGHTGKGGSDGRIVKESLVVHHLELGIATNSEQWSPYANDGVWPPT